MSYQSFEQILQKCHTEGKEFWQVILEDDMAERNVSKQDSMEHMRTTWDAMLLAAATYEGDIKSSSGLVGGDGQRMEEYTHNTGKESLCGEYVDECIAGALQMGESNACMKRIVAAPTAGACGVLPAVLVPYFQKRCRDTDKILKAMYVAAGIGRIIATRSSISGAAGGCQAEIGSASSMAAGALTYLQGRQLRTDCYSGCHGHEESAGTGMRSGSGTGGGSMRETKCDRYCECHGLCGYGNGGDRKPDSTGSGYGCHERSRG